MNADQLVSRTSTSLNLKVFKVDDGCYYVANSTGSICYRVHLDEGFRDCTCPDYQKHCTRDPGFRCQHIIAVLNTGDDPENVKFLRHHKPKLDKQFITQFQGKDFVLYSGLLDLAHQKGIFRINVDVEQFPTEENDHVAICRASVESVTGEEFIEWGDANPNNVNRKVAAHILRMAATRAKARALRDFTNIGMTCMEELGGMEEIEETPPANTDSKQKKLPEQKQKSEEPATKPIPISTKQGTGKPSVAQLKAIESLASRRGIKPEMLEELANEKYGTSYKQIAPSDAAAFIRYLQKSA